MEVASNVTDFLEWCAKEIAKFEEDMFIENMSAGYEDLDIESPIEQILYTALNAVAKLNLIDESDPEEHQGKMCVIGLSISSQVHIGKYRVDFKVGYGTYLNCAVRIKAPKKIQESNNHTIFSEVIVECDSQAFHERNEKERRYEKARDRFLQSNGYCVYHYTGTEIIKRPMEIAAEIISFVTGIDVENIQTDSNVLE
jgi:very-short-patch-repair endonuclease